MATSGGDRTRDPLIGSLEYADWLISNAEHRSLQVYGDVGAEANLARLNFQCGMLGGEIRGLVNTIRILQDALQRAQVDLAYERRVDDEEEGPDPDAWHDARVDFEREEACGVRA